MSKAPRSVVALVALALLAAGIGTTGAVFSATTGNAGNAVAAAPSFTACAAYRDMILRSQGLLSYWRLGEATGATTAADAVGSRTGTYTGGAVLGAPGSLTRENDTAVTFDGADDHVALGDAYDFAGTAPFTVEAWVNRTSAFEDRWRKVITKDSVASPRSGWGMGVVASGDPGANRFVFDRFVNGGYSGVRSTTVTVPSRWYYVVTTYDGATLRMYVDGVLEASTATTSALPDTTTPLRIGGISDSAWEFFPGSIDEVAIYGRALQASEVSWRYATNFDYRETVLRSSPASYWRLSESSGTTAADVTGAAPGAYSTGVYLNGDGAPAAAPDPSAAFDGAGAGVAAGDVYDFAGTAPFTAEAWVRRAAGADDRWRKIVSKDPGTSPRNGWALGLASTSDYRGGNRFIVDRFAGGTNNGVGGTTVAAAGVWYHVATTYDGSTIRLYVNGVLEGSAPSTLSLVGNAAPLRIGRLGDLAEGFLGTIDEVAVYPRALPAGELAQHYRSSGLFSSCAYPPTVMRTPGLWSYWRLNEAPGATAASDAMGVANGTYVNGVGQGALGGLPSQTDAGATFDGVDDRVQMGDVYDFAGRVPFSVEAWVRRTSVNETAWRKIVAKDTGTGAREGWGLAITSSSYGPAPQRFFLERFAAGVSNVVIGTTASVAGTWYHVVGTYDGSTMRIYLNGALEASAPSTTSMGDSTTPLRISGLGAGDAELLPGMVDEVAVYDRALSAAQVLEHYTAR